MCGTMKACIQKRCNKNTIGKTPTVYAENKHENTIRNFAVNKLCLNGRLQSA